MSQILKEQIGNLEGAEYHFLCGPPCCGKGEMAYVIDKAFTPDTDDAGINAVLAGVGMCVLGTSALIKKHVDLGTHLAQEFKDAQQLQASGKNVSDAPITEALALEIHEKYAQGYRTFVVDGYVRSEVQGKEVSALNHSYVFDVELDIRMCFQNLGRRLDSGIERVDNAKSLFPKRYKLYTDVWKKGPAAVRRRDPLRVKTLDGTCSVYSRVAQIIRWFGRLRPEYHEFIHNRLSDSSDPAGRRIAELAAKEALREPVIHVLPKRSERRFDVPVMA